MTEELARRNYRTEEELRTLWLWLGAGFDEVATGELEVSFTYERFELRGVACAARGTA